MILAQKERHPGLLQTQASPLHGHLKLSHCRLQQSISLTCSWNVVLERKLALLLRGVLKWPTWMTSNSWKLLLLQMDQGRLEPYPRMLSLQILLQLWFHPLTLTEGRSDLFSPLSSTQSHFILQALHLSNHISLTLVQPENKSHNTC